MGAIFCSSKRLQKPIRKGGSTRLGLWLIKSAPVLCWLPKRAEGPVMWQREGKKPCLALREQNFTFMDPYPGDTGNPVTPAHKLQAEDAFCKARLYLQPKEHPPANTNLAWNVSPSQHTESKAGEAEQRQQKDVQPTQRKGGSQEFIRPKLCYLLFKPYVTQNSAWRRSYNMLYKL